jgi:hypothetical protein
MKKSDLKMYGILLAFLIPSLAITGIGFLDNQIWNQVIAVVSIIVFAIVEFMFTIRFLHSSGEGKESYAASIIILVLVVIIFYQGILQFQNWLVSWPLWGKILALSIIGLFIFGTVGAMVTTLVKNRKDTKTSAHGDDDDNDDDE